MCHTLDKPLGVSADEPFTVPLAQKAAADYRDVDKLRYHAPAVPLH